MSLAYFVPELADATVRRRVGMFALGGETQVELFGFHRLRPGQTAPPPPQAHVLGETRNQAFLQRILAVVAALPKAARSASSWTRADAVVARNLEMLFLVAIASALSGARPRLVYECLDLHRLMLDRGPVGALLRAVERACLKRVDLVLVSSPAFERAHFRAAQSYAGPILLVENKAPAGLSAGASSSPRANGPPWTIAWCGVLRCRRSFAALLALAAAAPDRVRIELWGAPALDEMPDFHAALGGIENVKFRGAYGASDLPRIYGEAHFAWAVDYYEAGGNSDMLLPNRLYESLAFGASPLARAGVETARWLERHDVGAVLAEPIETSLAAFIRSLTPDAYERMAERAARLPAEASRATAADCAALVARIEGAA